jgi:formylglycine-generating enzyme required for sulfatase activity
VIDWVAIPAGPFAMGGDDFPPDPDEQPRRVVHVDAFRIGRLPALEPDGRPVTYVSLAEAEERCAAAGARLPTEAEWEVAARGSDDRLWPWGDEPPTGERATFGQPIGRPSVAGRQPAGASPFGLLDCAGNVGEWTAEGVVRGGSYLSGADALRVSARLPMHPATRDPYVGFRMVAVDPDAPGDWCEIPAGDYPVGRDPAQPRQVDVAAFEIARTPVTNAQYRAYVEATGAAAPPHWPAADDLPVTFVDWHEASGFCAWAGGRLPTGAEWEKAARGTDARNWPWGNEPDDGRAHVGAGIKHGAPAPVGSFAAGASPYGVLDLAGNVWEWVADEDPPGERVLRGGSYESPGLAWARCAMRSHSRPIRRRSHIGFRPARGGLNAR